MWIIIVQKSPYLYFLNCPITLSIANLSLRPLHTEITQLALRGFLTPLYSLVGVIIPVAQRVCATDLPVLIVFILCPEFCLSTICSRHHSTVLLSVPRRPHVTRRCWNGASISVYVCYLCCRSEAQYQQTSISRWTHTPTVEPWSTVPGLIW